MDYLDYREKLGIGFCDKGKFDYLVVKIFNTLNSFSQNTTSGNLAINEYYNFCNSTATPVNTNYLEEYRSRDRFAHCIAEIRKHDNDSREFFAYYIAFINSIKPIKPYVNAWGRKEFAIHLERNLSESHIPYQLFEIEGEYYVFPKGESTFDDALISQPLEWLSNYPLTQKTYIIALKQYSDGIFIRDVADNLRKALETFLQEFLGNTKNLENNKSEICKYLGGKSVDPGISGLFQPLINAYKSINDRVAKHNDEVDSRMLEFMLYQTGILVRMVITVKQTEKYDLVVD